MFNFVAGQIAGNYKRNNGKHRRSGCHQNWSDALNRAFHNQFLAERFAALQKMLIVADQQDAVTNGNAKYRDESNK